MSNRTASEADKVRGQNPQNVIEKITRMKIYDCDYWKERCFGLSAVTILDRMIELDHIGGAYSGVFRPTPFICLVLKLLQIGPDKEIVYSFIDNDDYKYITAVGLFYLRLVGTSLEIYKHLEPYYNDYRKLRLLTPTGWSIIHMDEFVEMLLEDEIALDISLPHLDKRHVLEARGELSPRVSILEDELNDIIKETENEENALKRSKREQQQKQLEDSEAKKPKVDNSIVCKKQENCYAVRLLSAFFFGTHVDPLMEWLQIQFYYQGWNQISISISISN